MIEPGDLARRLAASPLLHRVARACAGVDLFLTGGSLRDRILGVPTHDLDLVVGAAVGRCAAALTEAFGGSHFTLGRPPNVTHRVVAGRMQIDLWQAEGPLRDDIMRRDFTVNALFWRLPRGPLIDLVDGREDLLARRIRVVRPRNLHDDPLRVLRGVRLLASRPELRLTLETERHLTAAADGLTGVAKERVLSELLLLLDGPAVERAVLTISRLELLAPLLPSWQGFADASALARTAGELRSLARSRSRDLAAGARDVVLAVLAAPAAGFPDTWGVSKGADALHWLGLGRARARAVSDGVALGERLRPSLVSDRGAARTLAAEASARLPLAVAWAAARGAADGHPCRATAMSLLRWQRAFDRRPPLVGGDELAAVLELPADARRAEAVKALRLARARGEARTRRGALAFLRSRLSR
jgi:tRNA nucleotidyltransferase/poly(A) polymerase